MNHSSDGDGAHRGVVAIIPARGGSKGVPRKNLRQVGGISLIARAASSARHATLIDRVIVSTDDRAIAAAARAEGAEIMVRPAQLSGDTASSEAALLNVLDRLDRLPEIVVFLQATSPFIDSRDLDGAIARVRDGECDVVFSAVETHAFLWRNTERGAVGVNHEHTTRVRRQDRESQFQESGAFYVLRTSGLREARFRFFGRIGIAVVDESRAIEIDTSTQLEIACALAPLVDHGTTARTGAMSPIDVDALVTDFDGVHTDDRVLVGPDGSEFITANRADGFGVEALRRAGIAQLILSKETNGIAAVRGRKLQVAVRLGVEDKAAALAEWAGEQNLDLTRVAYLGNDVNDLGPLSIVGWPLAVADAHPAVRAAARVVLIKSGGHGAVREASDRILLAHNAGRSQPPEHQPGEKQWPLSLAENH